METPKTYADVAAMMKVGALNSALDAAKRHRELVNNAVALETQGVDVDLELEDSLVRKILLAGENLDRCLRSCIMHGIEREEIARELAEWLNPTYVRDLLDGGL